MDRKGVTLGLLGRMGSLLPTLESVCMGVGSSGLVQSMPQDRFAAVRCFLHRGYGSLSDMIQGYEAQSRNEVPQNARTPSMLPMQRCHHRPELLVLRLLVREPFPRPVTCISNPSLTCLLRNVPVGRARFGALHLRRKFSKLVADHILRYPDIVVDLAIVHLEDEADEVGQDRGTARLGLDWWYSLAWLWSRDWESNDVV